jgi:hypothetical protein
MGPKAVRMAKAKSMMEAKERIAKSEQILKEYDAIISDPNHEFTIEICIHCFNFQRRLTWMLNSILQQTGDIPNLIINISHTDNDGTPTTDEVCRFFRDKGLNIKELLMDKDKVHNRAVARNIQIKETMADYILFADSDMVYEPLFFADLKKQLQSNLKNEKKVMGANRISLNDSFCIDFFKKDKSIYPCVIPDVAQVLSKFPVKWVVGKFVAPGNFQLASVRAIKEKGSIYSGRQADVWRMTRSDRQFRNYMGGNVPINVLKMFHLNHERNGPQFQK